MKIGDIEFEIEVPRRPNPKHGRQNTSTVTERLKNTDLAQVAERPPPTSC